jgi:hypothetical protein
MQCDEVSFITIMAMRKVSIRYDQVTAEKATIFRVKTRY